MSQQEKRNIFHTDLDLFADQCHLCISLWDVTAFLGFRNQIQTLEDSVKADNVAQWSLFKTTPELHKTLGRRTPPLILDKLQFFRCMLPGMGVGPFGPVRQRLNGPVKAFHPTKDVEPTTILSSGSIRHAIFLGKANEACLYFMSCGTAFMRNEHFFRYCFGVVAIQ